MKCLYNHNVTNMCRGGLACPPLSTVLHNFNRLRHLIMVSIILMGERVNCANMIRFRVDIVGRTYMSALRCMKYFFNRDISALRPAGFAMGN